MKASRWFVSSLTSALLLAAGSVNAQLVQQDQLLASERLDRVEHPSTVWVDIEFGPGTSGWKHTRFRSIQAGIEAVTPGGVVWVAEGFYIEQLRIEKPMSVFGSGPQHTTLMPYDFGPGVDGMVKILADDVVLQGFNLYGFGNFMRSLVLDGDRITVSNNELTGEARSIEVKPGSDFNVIEDNLGISQLLVGSGADSAPASIHNRIAENTAEFMALSRVHSSVVLMNEVDSELEGIRMLESHDNMICDNLIQSTFKNVYLAASHGNRIGDNELIGDAFNAIELRESHFNLIEGNEIGAVQSSGILLVCAEDNEIRDNDIGPSATWTGLFLRDSPRTGVHDNEFAYSGLRISGEALQYWNTHDIVGNNANGRPIYYFVSVPALTVPTNAAQAILVDCVNFLAEDLTIMDVPGLAVAYTLGGLIRDSKFLHNECAIRLHYATDVTLLGNDLADGYKGIEMLESNVGLILDNYISSALLGSTGIESVRSGGFRIEHNVFAEHDMAIRLCDCVALPNTIHRNAFVGIGGVHDDGANLWDAGAGEGGNYWSGIVLTDSNGDGFGDDPIPIDGGLAQDNHPRVMPYQRSVLCDDLHMLTIADGGVVELVLDAGPDYAGYFYRVLGSFSGTAPGMFFDGVHVPLNPDAYTLLTVNHPDELPLSDFIGILDSRGKATARFILPPAATYFTTSVDLNHAYVVYPTLGFPALSGSQSVPLDLIF